MGLNQCFMTVFLSNVAERHSKDPSHVNIFKTEMTQV